jgi:shikimate kinase
MPGCGKSTVGVLLAKALGLDFTDTDLLIQRKCGMTLQEFINKNGIDAFLHVESEVLSSLETDHCVIATGGSAIYSEPAMQHLKQNAVAVYISLPLSEIEHRLTNISSRGIAMSPGTTIADLYNQRCPLYEKEADITLYAADQTVEETVRCACDLLRNRLL